MLPIEFLEAINVNEDSIKRYRDMLDTQADELASFRRTEVPSSAFGGSPLGREFGVHTSKAQKKVTEAIAGIAATLTGYRENIDVHIADTVSTDNGEAAVFTSLATLNACIPENFQSPEAPQQCTVPPEGDR